MLARQSGGDNGLLASPRSCYTAGDTQAALYLAAVLSVLSSDCNRAGGHFLSPQNKSLKEQKALEKNTGAFILHAADFGSFIHTQHLFTINMEQWKPKELCVALELSIF